MVNVPPGMTQFFAFYFHTSRLITLKDSAEFKRYHDFRKCKVFTFNRSKVVTFDIPKGKICFIKNSLRRTLAMSAEGIFETSKDFLDGLSFLFRAVAKIGETTNSMPSIETIKEHNMLLKLIKVIGDIMVLVQHPEPLTIANCLLAFYNFFSDIKIMQAQSLDALFFSGASMLLPPKIFEIFKRVSLFTNSKFLDDMHIVDNLVSIVHDFVRTTVIFFGFENYVTYIDKIFTFLPFGKKMILVKSMKEIASQYERDNRIMVSDSFRVKVKDLQDKITHDNDFNEWVKRSSYLNQLRTQFTRIWKNVGGYECAVRVEPNCFILEGPPGCMKSVTAGRLCEVLTLLDSKTVYSHHVKAVTDGKDWYDSYNNEDIFVMDDVGQQGISQWRTIINMVSPLRLPLDCAEVSLKNTKFFSSQTLILTTNSFMNLSGFTKNDCIADPHALWRRGFVFDFSQVKLDSATGKITGDVLFKYYDFLNKVWLNKFPSYFTNTDIPTKISSGDDLKLLAWMRSIIFTLNKYKNDFNVHSHLTESQIDQIQDICDDFNVGVPDKFHEARAEAFYDTFVDWTTWFIDLLIEGKTFLVAEILPALEIKDYVLLGAIGLVLGLLCYVQYRIPARSSYDTEAKYEKLKGLLLGEPDIDTSIAFLQKNVKDVKIKGSKGEFECTSLVSGHNIIVPAHVAFDDEVLIQVIQDPLKKIVLLDFIKAQRVFFDHRADVAIYRMPSKNFVPFKNLEHFFSPDKSGGQVPHLITSLGVINLDSILVPPSTSLTYYSNAPAGYTAYKNYLTPDNTKHYALSFPTLCGSILYDGSIRGIHVAGDGTNGASVVWSKELLGKIRSILANDKFIFPLDYKSDKFEDNTSNVQVDYRFVESTPKSSNFLPTQLFGVFPIEREPPNMLYDGKHTVKTLMKKNSIVNKPLDLDLYQRAVSSFEVFMSPFSVLSESEIVGGTPLLAPVNRKTSNGLFFEGDKDRYFDFEGKAFLPELSARVQEIEDSILEGKVHPDLLFVKSTLKDEVRDLSKKGKPRAFQVLPLSLQVLTKKYFGHFVENILQTRPIHKISVGINPYTEWHKLYEIIKVGKSFDMDFPDWDGNMMSAAQDIIIDFLMKYFRGTSNEKIIAEVVIRTLINKVIVCNDDAYFLTHGLPSGSFLTAIFNSLVNLLNGVAWFVHQTGYHPKKFFECVNYYTYGDDNLTNIPDSRLHDRLNAITYKDFLKNIGINCTTAAKTDVVEAFTPLEDLVFLKRGFKYSKELELVVGPLSLKTLRSGLSWYDSSSDDDPTKILRDKVNCFQREIFLHGEPIYSQYMDIVRKVSMERHFSYNELSKEYLIRVFRTDPTQFYEPMIDKYSFNIFNLGNAQY